MKLKRNLKGRTKYLPDIFPKKPQTTATNHIQILGRGMGWEMNKRIVFFN